MRRFDLVAWRSEEAELKGWEGVEELEDKEGSRVKLLAT